MFRFGDVYSWCIDAVMFGEGSALLLREETPVPVFWESPWATFQENQDLRCHTCAHSVLYAEVNIEECFLL